MKRRELFAMLAGAAALWPPAARAQAALALRVGAAAAAGRATLGPFQERLQELGYVEGKNFTYDVVDVQGHVERYGEAIREIVARKPDVILAPGPEAALKGALAASRSVPIVIVAFDYDPVALGNVASLARPMGIVTGVVAQQLELTVKRLQLVHDAFPESRAATMFWDRYSADQWRVAANAAQAMGLALEGVEFRDLPYDYERALDRVSPAARQFLFVLQGPAFVIDRARIAAVALDHRMVSFFAVRSFVDAGGLMSYGVSVKALYRRAAEYVDRIARGAKPADLPIEQPTKFELILNLKTAAALGLTIAPTLLVRADEVIE